MWTGVGVEWRRRKFGRCFVEPQDGRPPRRGRRPVVRKTHGPGRTEPKPDPIRGLIETSADGWRLLAEYEPDSYETTSAYALFHF